MLDQRDALSGIEVEDMVQRALGFIARTGPASDQDRWEENAGVNPFTLAVCIAALVAGAELLPSPAKDWALELADFWNSNIERWTAVSGTALANRLGVAGYHVRVSPLQTLEEPQGLRHVVPIRNRVGEVAISADEEVGTEFLQLVRFGLRDAPGSSTPSRLSMHCSRPTRRVARFGTATTATAMASTTTDAPSTAPG